ncbi:hypothetical protein ZHAS_00011295 [Anopheles sinensis]|uniref:Uncharacterized protein n=1 Tax=Anopheles sinensis TaxID=74873 RepID=A0A084VZU6_ANOSI|nr:hypothetical protein ZHAS_00011295 [Anopheles sinensis]
MDHVYKSGSTGPLHTCFICKTELCSRTRPLERSRAAQYSIPEAEIPSGARICNSCQCKSVKSRYTHCPLPTCPNPKDRVKRFRNLPPRLFELAPEIRDPIVQELQIPPNVSKCCSACLTRIRRKMGPHLLGSTTLTDEEVARLKTMLQEHGPKWIQLAESLAKPPLALKSCYFHFKKKYGLDMALNEYYKQHPSEDRRSGLTDGDDSDLSAGSSSSDERDGSSDTTASAESPTSGNTTVVSVSTGSVPVVTTTINSGHSNSVVSGGSLLSEAGENISKLSEGRRSLLDVVPSSVDSSGSGSEGAISLAPPAKMTASAAAAGSSSASSGSSSVAFEDDRLLPPGQPQPKKHHQRHTEEYDSSATETADEENESSPANRQSPKVALHHPGPAALPPPSHTSLYPSLHHSSAAIAMVHNSIPSHQQPNGPRYDRGNIGNVGNDLSSPQNVRDVMLNVIERSLKNNSLVAGSKPPPPGLRDGQFATQPPQHQVASSSSSQSPNSQPSSAVGGGITTLAGTTAVRDYRGDGSKLHTSGPGGTNVVSGICPVVTSSSAQSSLPVSQQQQSPQLSVPVSSLGITIVNPHGQIIGPTTQQSHSSIPATLVGTHGHTSHHHQLGSQIPATITPIPHSIHHGPASTLSTSLVRTASDEPQTLDLSIKKTPRLTDSSTLLGSSSVSKSMEIGSSGGNSNLPPPPAHSNHHGGVPTGVSGVGSNGSGGSNNGSNLNSGSKFLLGLPGPPNSLGASVTVFRADHAFTGASNPSPSTVSTGLPMYVSYHPTAAAVSISDAMGRPLTKSPSGATTYLTTPLGLSGGPGGASMQPSGPVVRQSGTLSSLTPPPTHVGGGMKGKSTPKLSPKLSSGGSGTGSSGGGVPKGGSITHGTPVNVGQQQHQLIIQGQPSGTPSLSPRYENHLLRQTPPSSVVSGAGCRPGSSSSPVISNEKFIGSITQGTPVHGGSGGLLLPDKRNSSVTTYEYKRQSPAQTVVGPPSGNGHATQFPSYGARGGGNNSVPGNGTYSPLVEPTSQRQIIMNDYITSQQMQGRSGIAGASSGNAGVPLSSAGVPMVVTTVDARGGRTEKESPSPRTAASISGGSQLSLPPGSIYGLVGSNVVGGPSTIVTRQPPNDYLSRASPASDHMNRISPVYSNTSSPHRTPPPPQRQGVIQRHNTSNNACGNNNVGTTVGAIGMNASCGGSSKSPSPAPVRYHMQQPAHPHHYLQGTNAFHKLNR